jgi:PIN domain nuclease of toxin-antitoxin system
VGRSGLILLDTHVVIWLAQDYRRISPAALKAIEVEREKERGLAVSDITLFEIALLASRRRVNFKPDVETTLSEVEHRFIVLPVTANIARQAFDLPPNYPNDPVDRIIGATALIEDIPLLTADREIHKSQAIATVW